MAGVDRVVPHAAHHALMQDLGGTCDRFEADGMAKVEQIAVLAQLIGSHMHFLPADAGYTPQMILEFVARNIHLGNQHAAGGANVVAGLVGGEVAGHG